MSRNLWNFSKKHKHGLRCLLKYAILPSFFESAKYILCNVFIYITCFIFLEIDCIRMPWLDHSQYLSMLVLNSKFYRDKLIVP